MVCVALFYAPEFYFNCSNALTWLALRRFVLLCYALMCSFLCVSVCGSVCDSMVALDVALRWYLVLCFALLPLPLLSVVATRVPLH